MKLNLLPTYVSKEKQARSAIVIAALLALGMGAAAFFMISSSKKELADLQDEATEKEPQYQQVVKTSNEADAIIASARDVIINQNLAAEMQKHNSVYTDLYDEVRRYIPAYYRIHSLTAAPSGDSCTVTMVGVLQTYQQYADIMLALLRIPGASGVTRSGFTLTDAYVPGLTPIDQQGRPIKNGEAPIPDDPLERLRYFEAKGSITGFNNTGGFGSTDPTVVKGAMPNWSEVTTTVTLKRNLLSPDPKSTLASAASGPTSTPAPGSAVSSVPAPNTGPTTPGKGGKAGRNSGDE